MNEDIEGVFRKLHQQVSATVGCRLFTILALDLDEGTAWRAYTSHPVEYPVTGTKPIHEDAWFRQVVVEGRAFVANALADFAHLFPDHALIRSLGCEAVVNLPVHDKGSVIAVVNVLDKPGHFTPQRVAALEALVRRHGDALASAVHPNLWKG